jgi:hypothetical protein
MQFDLDWWVEMNLKLLQKKFFRELIDQVKRDFKNERWMGSPFLREVW